MDIWIVILDWLTDRSKNVGDICAGVYVRGYMRNINSAIPPYCCENQIICKNTIEILGGGVYGLKELKNTPEKIGKMG